MTDADAVSRGFAITCTLPFCLVCVHAARDEEQEEHVVFLLFLRLRQVRWEVLEENNLNKSVGGKNMSCLGAVTHGAMQRVTQNRTSE